MSAFLLALCVALWTCATRAAQNAERTDDSVVCPVGALDSVDAAALREQLLALLPDGAAQVLACTSQLLRTVHAPVVPPAARGVPAVASLHELAGVALATQQRLREAAQHFAKALKVRFGKKKQMEGKERKGKEKERLFSNFYSLRKSHLVSSKSEYLL